MAFVHTPSPLKQGQLVGYFINPTTTVGRELSGKTVGVVMTDTHYNASGSHSVMVCPLAREGFPHNEKYGVPFEMDRYKGFLRPDLLQCSKIDLLYDLYGKNKNGQPLVVPPSVFRITAAKLIDIITPTQSKLSTPTNGMLRYGSARWFSSIPRPDERVVTDRAPVLCLTPQEIFRDTGVVLVSRAYTNFDKMHPMSDVAVAPCGFKVGYYPTNLVTALSVERASITSPLACIGFRALKGFMHKFAAHVDEDERQRVHARYVEPIGTLPEYLRPQLHRQDARVSNFHK